MFIYLVVFIRDLIFLLLYIFTRTLELISCFIYDNYMQFCVYFSVCEIIGLVQYYIQTHTRTDYT